MGEEELKAAEAGQIFEGVKNANQVSVKPMVSPLQTKQS